jgi:outer membrane protein assembly factor BamB
MDGRVYALDGPVGSLKWVSALNVAGDGLTGAPAKMLVNGGAAYNLILVGTRNATAGNRLLGLDAGTGNTLFSYAGGGGIGIISSEVAVNTTGNRAYFTSRAGGSGQTVWCVQVSGAIGSPTAAACPGFASPSVGDVDTPPTLFINTLYVGGNDGKVSALDATTGAILWTINPNDGAVRGRIHRDNVTNRIWFATATKVWGYKDNGTFGTSVLFSAPIAGGSSPILYNGKVYVGSANGSIHEMDAATGGTLKSVVLGTGTAQVGAPSIDGTSSVVYAGTEDGKTYSVVVPF